MSGPCRCAAGSRNNNTLVERCANPSMASSNSANANLCAQGAAVGFTERLVVHYSLRAGFKRTAIPSKRGMSGRNCYDHRLPKAAQLRAIPKAHDEYAPVVIANDCVVYDTQQVLSEPDSRSKYRPLACDAQALGLGSAPLNRPLVTFRSVWQDGLHWSRHPRRFAATRRGHLPYSSLVITVIEARQQKTSTPETYGLSVGSLEPQQPIGGNMGGTARTSHGRVVP